MPTAAHRPTTTYDPEDTRLEPLRDFRAGLHAATLGWADSSFELCEAMLCASGPITSAPSLSLEPCFRRSHGSLYKAAALHVSLPQWRHEQHGLKR